MRIAILTLGSRGDVQPFVALGKALRGRGHDVRLAAPDDFGTWIRSHGLAFHPMGVDIKAIVERPDVRRAIAGNFVEALRLLRSVAMPMMRASLEATWAAARDAEAIIHHPKVVGAPDVAEKTGASLFCASPVPVFPTGNFPITLTGRTLGRPLNRLSWAPARLLRAPYAGVINAWRRDRLNLPKGRAFPPIGQSGRGLATRLCAVSPAVVPKPPDWDDTTHMTGYWMLDEGAEWRPDPALAAFLAAGPAPVYIGFGSMPSRDPERLAQATMHGAVRAGVRAILATGWGALATAEVPETIHVIEGAPHDRLFPLTAAVVHHGGAGTTAASLHAGRPTLVCPMAVDQPFWGARIARLGCGPAALPLKRLTADSLAARLRDLTANTVYRDRARDLSATLEAEDGVGAAVSVIENAHQTADRIGVGTSSHAALQTDDRV